MTTCLLLTVIVILVLPEGRSQHTKFSVASRAPHHERLMYAYSLDGCAEEHTINKRYLEGAGTSKAKMARLIALGELERRANRLLMNRFRAEGSANNEFKKSVNQSLRLNSRFLEYLRMEVVTIPEGISKDEMEEISRDVPCVDFFERDSIKSSDSSLHEEISTDEQSIGAFNSFLSSRLERSIPSFQRPRDADGDGTINHSLSADPFLLRGSLRGKSEQTEEESISIGSLTTYDEELRAWAARAPTSHTRHLLPYGLNSLTPKVNDPLYSAQWALGNTSKWGIGWSSFDDSDEDALVTVAVIDSGCDIRHEDIRDAIWVNHGEADAAGGTGCYDGIDNDGNGYVDDCWGWDWADGDNDPSSDGANGHGTGAAGIIAAVANNGKGIVGVCPLCRIMCLRFISKVDGKVSDQVAAIDYALRMKAKISNNSYGGYGESRMERAAIERAQRLGHIFVSSAGNNRVNTDDPEYFHTPSGYDLDNIVAVAASSEYGDRAHFSNYGKMSVDLFAPGTNLKMPMSGGGYDMASGTSFAAPHVTGIIGVLLSKYHDAGYRDLLEAIRSSCTPRSSLKSLCGCQGIVSLEGSIKRIEAILNPVPNSVTTSLSDERGTGVAPSVVTGSQNRPLSTMASLMNQHKDQYYSYGRPGNWATGVFLDGVTTAATEGLLISETLFPAVGAARAALTQSRPSTAVNMLLENLPPGGRGPVAVAPLPSSARRGILFLRGEPYSEGPLNGALGRLIGFEEKDLSTGTRDAENSDDPNVLRYSEVAL